MDEISNFYEFKNYHNTTVAVKLAKITPTKTIHTITPAKYLNNTSVMMEKTKKQKIIIVNFVDHKNSQMHKFLPNAMQHI